MLSRAKWNRNISDFSGRLGFREKRGMTLGICEIFNAQALSLANPLRNWAVMRDFTMSLDLIFGFRLHGTQPLPRLN